MRCFAIIPAAGKSVRMGRPKLSLPLGESTVLEWVLRALRSQSLADILVIVGPGATQLRDVTENAGASVLTLQKETPDMRATVECGLSWLEEKHRPSSEDAFLLCPADHPALDPTVVASLLHQANTAKPGKKTLWIPCHGGQRGHPTLVAWSHVRGIRNFSSGLGLNHYFRRFTDEVAEVQCSSPEILVDLDTKADYKLLRDRISKLGTKLPIT